MNALADDRWRRTDASARPTDEWITTEAPNVRIVSDELWTTVRDRLTGIKAVRGCQS
jgi:hypothetical protein